MVVSTQLVAAVSSIAGATYVTLVGTVLYQMRVIRRMQTERMERAEALLTGTVHVDGLYLPLTSDPRWKPAQMIENGIVRAALGCGRCWITTNTIVVGDAGVTAPGVLVTRTMLKYIDSVWAAYRNRIIQDDVAKADMSALKGLDE